MRTLTRVGGLIVLGLTVLGAGPAGRAAEPTEEQLDEASKAFKAIGGSYSKRVDENPKRTLYVFSLPKTVTDEDLKKVPNLPFEFGLGLGSTAITDAGLKELTGHKQLVYLDLYETKVTDAGIKKLAALKKLTALILAKTKVTDAGIKQLRAALPKCEVY